MNKKLIEKVRKRANCAESVFRAVYESVDTNLPPEISGLVTPLGGGIATRGENCGAMLAGAVALGLVYGRTKPYEQELKEHRSRLWDTYSLFNQIPHRFKEKFGTINCWELTEPYTYGTKDCRKNCESIIGETAAMAMELLLEAEEKGFPFEFKKSIVTQALKLTGMSIKELIEYKRKGEPFPIANKR
jgi:C_GCAxxG_C_C family probable redox protein